MSGQSARADIIVDIPALQDATLFGASPANNNSSSGPGMFVGSDGAGNPKRGLIQFDIPAFVPSNATITNASLSLVLGQVAGGGGAGDSTPRTISLLDVTTAWAGGTNGVTTPNPPGSFPGPGFGGTGQGFSPNVGDVTWNFSKVTVAPPSPIAGTPWLTPGGGGDFVSTASAATLVSQNLNTAYLWGSTAQMVSDVQGWLDGALPNFGWLLENASEATPTTFRAFYTREGAMEQGVPDFAPELTVSFLVPVPEPSSLGLTALGALTILFLLRRRRRKTTFSWTKRPCPGGVSNPRSPI
jgi:hypothetical protein